MKTAMIILLTAMLVLTACAHQPTGQNTTPMVGGDKDAHGCIASAGYTWCDAKQKCLRTWEEPCNGTENTTGNATLANPASVNCVKQGGTLEIRDTADGQIGVCHLNGDECEEWALFRGEGCVAPEGASYVACPNPRPSEPVACTMDYTPVCAVVDTGVRCIKAPCPMASENKTYGNACTACADPNVYGYVPGECPA